jgi:hypothetical protein
VVSSTCSFGSTGAARRSGAQAAPAAPAQAPARTK